MKKLLTIFSVIMAICVGTVYGQGPNGQCPVLWSQIGNDGDSEDDDLIVCAARTKSQCWFYHCSEGCGNGTTVVVLGPHWLGDETDRTGISEPEAYRCSSDDWGGVGVKWCPDTRSQDLNDRQKFDVFSRTPSGARYQMASVATDGSESYAVVVPQNGCIVMDCKLGTKWDSSTNECVSESEQTEEEVNPAIDDCRDSGGEWDTTVTPNVCKCDTSKGFNETPVNNQCVCADSNKEYDFVAEACVPTAQATCTNTGGNWDNGECTCDTANKHVVPVPGVVPTRCECESDRYMWDNPKSKGCILTPKARQEEEDYGILADKCEKSGGIWMGEKENRNTWQCKCDATNGLRTELYRCVCLDETYERPKPDSKFCELTDVKKAQDKCEEAIKSGVNVKWIDDGKKSYCKCVETNKYFDPGTLTCVSYQEQQCNKITGAHILNGKCVCKATGKPVPASGCPTDKKGGANTSVKQPDTTKTKTNIKNAHDALGTISGAWGKSRWKTASGNFNGARLASDSVAGVVLGTVGGVITSNVVKKNQVRGGFEDLRCVIGGQSVADWGDQFMVGVQ